MLDLHGVDALAHLTAPGHGFVTGIGQGDFGVWPQPRPALTTVEGVAQNPGLGAPFGDFEPQAGTVAMQARLLEPGGLQLSEFVGFDHGWSSTETRPKFWSRYTEKYTEKTQD